MYNDDDHARITAPRSLSRCLNDARIDFSRLRPRISVSRLPLLFASMIGLAASMVSFNAHADPLTVINAIRSEGCGGVEPAGSPVVLSTALTEVARELPGGNGLDAAVERTAYPASSSVAMYVKGRVDDAAVRQIIEDDYCEAFNNPRFNEAGIHLNGNEVWIVLAARMDLPEQEDSRAIAARVLELVNAARAAPRQCGDRMFEPAPPLRLSPPLTDVAAKHAQDMAEHRHMDHRGSDDSMPNERVTRAGYRWRSVGENVAAGQPNADEVVAGWLDSPGHCANIMSPKFTEMGLAFALVAGNPATYWAQVFALPR